ncbi:MAG TPA: LptF/LptG family permease [Rhizomicrobium sp.]|jgi:lipopolysaccharide export system permease protein|nr:LptF/LptG family permease [Rhizomicrobium sp.]
MPRLSFYVLRQLVGPVALFIFLLTCVIWLSQSLRLLDLVINRGQSAPTFFYLTLLMLPSLLVIILPVAYFAGTLYGLHKLNADSELTVMSAAGFSRSQLLTPVLIAAAVVMVATYLCSLYLMPFCQRLMKDKEINIRADIGAAILNEGQFNTPAQGLTVFMRELSPDGHLRGILVHDERDRLHPTTYLAESGVLAQTLAGARLIMLDGTIEQSTPEGPCRGSAPPRPKNSHDLHGNLPKCPAGFRHAPPSLSVLKFQRYVFDLDQFGARQQDAELRTSERYLGELLWPSSTKPLKPAAQRVYFAEANNRLAAPLYCPAFALIAFAAVTLGRRARGVYALRLASASILAAGLRIAGYGVQGLGVRSPILCSLFYLIPLIAGAAALAEIAGYDLAWVRARLHPRILEPAT